jgi:hypothetical protein
MTLDAAEIDLSRTFEPGQGYVALSRIKSIEGLKLMGINDMALKVDSLILQIDDRMKMASKRASDEIKNMSDKEKAKKFEDTIRKNDGIIQKTEIEKEQRKITKERKETKDNIKKGKVSIYEKTSTPNWKKTEKIIKSSKTLPEILEKSDFALDTILNHIYIIKKNNPKCSLEKIKPKIEIFDMVSEVVQELVEENKKGNFSDDGTLKLKPIFKMLDGEVDYDDIKLSLLFIS